MLRRIAATSPETSARSEWIDRKISRKLFGHPCETQCVYRDPRRRPLVVSSAYSGVGPKRE